MRINQSKHPAYAPERYFSGGIPSDVNTTLKVEGVRPLSPGSKFKIANQRGEFIFLYERGGIVSCFTSQGQFYSVRADQISRAINRSARERAAA